MSSFGKAVSTGKQKLSGRGNTTIIEGGDRRGDVGDLRTERYKILF